jgi:hypothetical protein
LRKRNENARERDRAEVYGGGFDGENDDDGGCDRREGQVWGISWVTLVAESTVQNCYYNTLLSEARMRRFKKTWGVV